MLRAAHLVAAALAVCILVPSSPSWAQSTKAGVVTTLEGNVTVTRIALPPQPLKFRDDVFVNDRVTTGEQSLARMLLGGKAVVTVRERSALTITEVPGKATIDLAAGKIAVAVAKDKMRPGESIEIRAANAIAGIRGTVVVAEVSSASAQAAGGGGLTGTFWVLRGAIEAFLANQPGTPFLVGALQQFRGGAVTNIAPGQMAQILSGLSSTKLPTPAGSDEQAKEEGINAGLALVGAFTGVGAGLSGIVTPPAVLKIPTPPILPGNQPIPQAAPPVVAPVVLPPPPVPPPGEPCDPVSGGYGHPPKDPVSGGGSFTTTSRRSPRR
jgi:FecR protein